MSKEEIIRKLTSRKFWVAIAGFVAGLIVFFGGTAETAEKVTGLILAGASCLAYIIGEGLIDVENSRKPETGFDLNDIDNMKLINEIIEADAQGLKYRE